jgi:uncharacterized protein
MKIQVASLEEGENLIDAEESAEALGLTGDVSARGPIRLSLSAYLQGRSAQIVGTAEGAVVEECSRCLTPVESPFSTGFTILADERRPGAPESEDDPEIFIVKYQHGVLDISALVREAILLDRPIRTLCTPQCLGLCPGCGANLNLEPCRCGSPAPASGEAPSRPRDTKER